LDAESSTINARLENSSLERVDVWPTPPMYTLSSAMVDCAGGEKRLLGRGGEILFVRPPGWGGLGVESSAAEVEVYTGVEGELFSLGWGWGSSGLPSVARTGLKANTSSVGASLKGDVAATPSVGRDRYSC